MKDGSIEEFHLVNTDYRLFADDERYLFGVVTERFQAERMLGGYDLMAIARWKAERARVHVARRLVSRGAASVVAGARALTGALSTASTDADRFRVVMGEWRFRLPMGSAILTVCFPKSFSVYDRRVCSQLGDFETLVNISRVESLWTGYRAFVKAVRETTPSGLSLRECDLWLWGRSRHEELTALLSSPEYTAAALQL